MFDEFHERSLASDLALAMVRQIQQTVRPDLKIVVMSATLAVEPIARYLGDCPTVESRGRMFPVEVQYMPHLERRPIAELVDEGVASDSPSDSRRLSRFPARRRRNSAVRKAAGAAGR